MEAHLFRQYHRTHNEFVFGFPLTAERAPCRPRPRLNTPADKISVVEKEDSAVALFLQEEYSSSYARMPEGWAAKQLKEGLQPIRKGQAFKPRRILLAASDDGIEAAVLCIHKRGGSAKLLLASRTSHSESLFRLVAFAEEHTQRTLGRALRKVYTFVPGADSVLQGAFSAEGLLDRPYRSSDDLLILAKMLAN